LGAIEAHVRVSTISIDDPRWREFTASHPDAGPFHLPEWAGLISDCYRFRPFVLASCDGDGELLAGLPTLAVRFALARPRLVSLPFSDSCPVLARPDVDMGDFVAALHDYVRAGGYRDLEVRSGLSAANGWYPVEVGYQHVVELPREPADLRPHKNFRQHRNQAERRGVRVRRGGAESVSTFYRLHTLTRRRLGVPVQPRGFFDLLADRILEPGHGYMAIASLDGEDLAAAVCLVHGTTVVAKYQASDPSRREIGASHLMHCEIMSDACRQGYRSYDLGRCDAGSEGLRVFKKRMGAVETPLVYAHIGDRRPRESRPGVGRPYRSLICKSPTWVCRALGETCYRWTA
jgi:CelD/BcsL family acetyltransferase involved in cellulose biosynthesis